MEQSPDNTKYKVNQKNSLFKIEQKKSNINDNTFRNSSNFFLSTNKKSLNQNFTIDSENNKVIFGEEENKNYHGLANGVRVQNKIIEIYAKWVSTLLSVIDNNKTNNTYNDIGTPIQKELENIEKLKEENFKIKTSIINKKIQNENFIEILEKKKKIQNLLIKDFNDKNPYFEENLGNEKKQLEENLQILANELDEINENNKNLNDKIMKDKTLKSINDLVNLRNQLKQENKLYKKIVVLKNRKNYSDLKGNTLNHNESTIDGKEYRRNKLNNMKKNLNNNYGSLGPITGYGEYKLEKEENINSNGNVFLCGL